MAYSLLNQGDAASDQGNYEFARTCLEESVSMHRTEGDLRALGRALSCLGRTMRRQGDLESAAAILGEGLKILQTLGDSPGVAKAIEALARLAHMHNRTVEAQALYRDALSIERAVGLTDEFTSTLEGLGNTFAAASPLTAARLWGHAQCVRETIDAGAASPEMSENDRFVGIARETLGDAAAFDAAWQEGRAMTLDQAVQYAMSAPAPPCLTASSSELPIGLLRL
jgi:tetratricopeptide (TPR) repeat protein